MFGFLFLIVATVFIYRTARSNGYNPILWSVVTVAVFFGIQIAFSLILGIILAIGTAVWGWSPDALEAYSFPLGLVVLAASIGGIMLVLRHVNTIRDDESVNLPPPPTFNAN